MLSSSIQLQSLNACCLLDDEIKWLVIFIHPNLSYQIQKCIKDCVRHLRWSIFANSMQLKTVNYFSSSYMFENVLPKYASENSHTCSEIKEKIYQKHIIKNICSKLTNKNTKTIGETYSSQRQKSQNNIIWCLYHKFERFLGVFQDPVKNL